MTKREHSSGVRIRPLISSDEIQRRLTGLVSEIAGDLPHTEIVLVGLMRGAFMFISDLARMFYYHQIPIQIDFMTTVSYEGKRSSGRVRVLKDVGEDLTDRDVLLVDDVLDTGLTLEHAYKLLSERKARSLQTCVLLDKQVARTISLKPTYVGFTIDDAYVVGYGLDYNNRFRELPFIGVLEDAPEG